MVWAVANEDAVEDVTTLELTEATMPNFDVTWREMMQNVQRLVVHINRKHLVTGLRGLEGEPSLIAADIKERLAVKQVGCYGENVV
jgi:hypothetical protein